MKNILQFLTVLITIVTLIVSALIFIFIGSDFSLPYWQKFQINDIVAESAIGILSLCILLLLMSSGFQLFHKPSRNVVQVIVCIILSFLAVGLACTSTILVNVFEGDHIYRGDIEFTDKRYYVDSSWKPGVGSIYLSSFWLNECDSEGKNCHTVFEKKYRRIPDNEYKNMAVNFVTDSSAHTLTLQINGETVYVHPVK